jgi:glycosyltransferase involved in cell wall biosynthesis
LPRASFVITGTRVGKDEIVHYYGVNPDNVRIIPHPVPGEDWRKTSIDIHALHDKFKIEGDYLFYPAQFWPHKNHVNLLMALDILRNRNGLRLNLVLTGSDMGNKAYVLAKVRELRLSDQVFDLGFVSREELNTIYMNALALVYPSFFGPENLPPLEAFSLECPVLASRIAGAEEQLCDGALLFDPADPADIANKILTIRSDAALRKKLTEKGARIVLSRTPEKFITRVHEILDGFAAIRRCWGEEYDHM